MVWLDVCWVRYVDVLQLVEVLHGPQPEAILTKVLAMVDPERFSPRSRRAQSSSDSSQLTASARQTKDVSRNTDVADEGEFVSSDADTSAQAGTRPFGLKGAKRLAGQSNSFADVCVAKTNTGCRADCMYLKLDGMLACRDPQRSSTTLTP